MPASPQWRFDRFRLDPDHACLWCEAQAIALPPKAFAVLHYLVTHPDRLVSKDELLDAVWPETAVSDAVVRVAIGALRKVLGDTAQPPRFIATVPRRGYRFLAPVEEHTDGEPVPVPVPAGLVPVAAPQLPETLPPPEAERRHLTVLFCDLVDSTTLAGHLDPEDLREVVRAYHQACAAVIHRFDGYIAQYLGDGVLVYFGYPLAHEDDAQRAVWTGLGLLEAINPLNTRLALPPEDQVAVRLGVHTGLVVVDDVGAGARHEPLALGETPNVAARLQHLAAPNTLVISATTYHLIAGYFTCEALGAQPLRGLVQPLQVYRVLGASGVQSRLEVAAARGLTPMVGRAPEVALLRERWARVKAGMGQVVVLEGEAGIGKSRLVQVLKDHVAHEAHLCWECRGSPYYQHTALYPIIEFLQRWLQWQPGATPAAALEQLEIFLTQAQLALDETVPLLADLVALPLPAERYPPQPLSPEQQRQRTLEVLLALLGGLAEQQPVLVLVEDLHWVDPSTRELLGLLIDQVPTTCIYTVVTSRPALQAPWGFRAHLTPLALNRLTPSQTEAMVEAMLGEQRLPGAVLAQIVAQTDGIPLFVEEVTKAVLEAGRSSDVQVLDVASGPRPALAIPVTLHEALLARLDRLGSAKGVAQLGATLGREFPYALLQAVSPWDEETLQRGLHQLVAAELLYQRGLPPQATYRFKHTLIQEAAYQSLLKRTRQRHHRQSAQVLEAQFPATAETQPELLAYHYTAAGCRDHAVGYWHRAGVRALQRSANPEAVQHLTTGLALLATLPETPARDQQELALQIALGPALSVTQGMAAPAVEQTYARARALCAQVGETPQLFQTLRGLSRFYQSRGALQTARELAEQLSRLAQRGAAPTPRLEAHDALGSTLFFLGDYAAAWTHLAQGIALTDAATQQALALHIGEAPGVRCLTYAALTLWCLGYPAQALRRSQEALALAQALPHPHSLAHAQHFAAFLHHHRREAPASLARAEALLTLATAQGFPHYVGFGTCWWGGALAMQGQGEAGLAQMRQGMAAVLATGQGLARPLCLVLLAEAAGHAGQVNEGLRLLAEALTALEASGRGDLLAEAYRLQGACLLRHAVPETAQAEACFQQALTIARHQQAMSWELRAATSLARLWQQQGKRAEAYELLAPIYGWFTEGFDTADLQEAKALLEAWA